MSSPSYRIKSEMESTPGRSEVVLVRVGVVALAMDLDVSYTRNEQAAADESPRL